MGPSDLAALNAHSIFGRAQHLPLKGAAYLRPLCQGAQFLFVEISLVWFSIVEG